MPLLDQDDVEELAGLVHRPVIAELARRGTPFAGLLYAGLMLTESGPRVLEFNCRFGDPETQALLPRIEGDLLEALAAAAHGDLTGVELEPSRSPRSRSFWPQAAIRTTRRAGSPSAASRWPAQPAPSSFTRAPRSDTASSSRPEGAC